MPLDFRESPNDQQFRRRRPPDYLARRTQYRILALIVGLFLVFFLMEQARKPEHWQWIWMIGGDRVPVEAEVDTRVRPSPGSTDVSDHVGPLVIADDSEPSTAKTPPDVESKRRPEMARPAKIAKEPEASRPVRQARHDLWSRLLESLGDDQRDELLLALKAARDKQTLETDAVPSWQQIVGQLEAGWQDYAHKAFLAINQDSGRLTDAEKESWLHVIETLQGDWKEDIHPALQAMGDGRRLDDRQHAVLGDLQRTLDRVFLDSIRDNTVFRGAERDAWFRMLEQLDQRDLAALRRESIGYVGFLQLYKQPEAYRGKLVTVAGTVRMGYYREAPENLYGIPGYYVFWLRPTGAQSPIVVYCLEIPDGFPDVARLERDGQRPQLDEDVEFTGFFFKRWAYRAQDDTRLAPLILAKVPRWERRFGAEDNAGQAPSPWFWTLTFGGTGAFGIGSAAIFFWLTRRASPTDAPLRLEFLERDREEEKP